MLLFRITALLCIIVLLDKEAALAVFLLKYESSDMAGYISLLNAILVTLPLMMYNIQCTVRLVCKCTSIYQVDCLSFEASGWGCGHSQLTLVGYTVERSPVYHRADT